MAIWTWTVVRAVENEAVETPVVEVQLEDGRLEEDKVKRVTELWPFNKLSRTTTRTPARPMFDKARAAKETALKSASPVGKIATPPPNAMVVSRTSSLSSNGN